MTEKKTAAKKAAPKKKTTTPKNKVTFEYNDQVFTNTFKGSDATDIAQAIVDMALPLPKGKVNLEIVLGKDKITTHLLRVQAMRYWGSLSSISISVAMLLKVNQ